MLLFSTSLITRNNTGGGGGIRTHMRQMPPWFSGPVRLPFPPRLPTYYHLPQERQGSNLEPRFWRPKCYPVTPHSHHKAHVSRRQESNLLATHSHSSFTDYRQPIWRLRGDRSRVKP